jgi:hypothetical protein
MQEDLKDNQQTIPAQKITKKNELAESKFEKNSSSGLFGGGSMSPRKNASKRNKQLKEDLDVEKNKLIKTKGTLGRGALREVDEYGQMLNLETRDPSKLQNLDRIEIMHGKYKYYLDLSKLDKVIYKEGRTKRNRQSLQDSMLSKLKLISDSYDDLFNLVGLIKDRYHELGMLLIICRKLC